MDGLFDIAGRLAVVTGANGHIGRTVCAELIGRGAHAVLTDVDPVPSDDLIPLLEGCTSNQCTYVHMDLADADSRALGIDAIAAQFESIDILINNAALAAGSSVDGYLVDLTNQGDEAFRLALEINLVAPFALIRGLLPQLRRSTHASVINIASIYGLVGSVPSLYAGTEMATPVGYAASKGGLVQMTRHLATNLAPTVRVNAICPGGIARSQSAEFVGRYVDRTPMGRLGSENDVVGAILWLASDASSYVTGQAIAVDGGWTAW